MDDSAKVVGYGAGGVGGARHHGQSGRGGAGREAEAENLMSGIVRIMQNRISNVSILQIPAPKRTNSTIEVIRMQKNYDSSIRDAEIIR